MDKKELLKSFRNIGHHLLLMGMNSSHSGNISVCDGETVYIKRTGAMLGMLSEEDIVEVPIGEAQSSDASLEYPLHREIYLQTKRRAVIHCHPPHAISLSLSCDEIVPVDLEGRHHLKSVPVVLQGDDTVKNVAACLKEGSMVAAVRGHGIFSVGDTLEEALHYASTLEMSSKIIVLASFQSKSKV